MGEAPSGPALRGDYSRVRPDYTVDQDWQGYSAAEHEVWRTLNRRQTALLPRYACREYVEAIDALGVADGIPRFDRVSEHLDRATGWRLVAVPGLIPSEPFYDHLANRRFPVTVWIRTPQELDYLVEPDLFHDFFGHVPLLTDPVFADYMQAYGRKGPEAMACDGVTMLTRLYWYMVEFGLIRTQEGLRAFGAGMLSSSAELAYSIDDPRPNRLRFDRDRVMRTDYRIDAFQTTYFVLDRFEELFEATQESFAPLYRRLRALPDIPAAAVLPEDGVLHRGRPGRTTAA